MTTRRRSSKAVQRKGGRRDLQVEEFESRDLGEDIRAAGGLRPIRKTLPTSIVLEQDLIDKLRKKAAKRGLGYQTMLKVIVRELKQTAAATQQQQEEEGEEFNPFERGPEITEVR